MTPRRSAEVRWWVREALRASAVIAIVCAGWGYYYRLFDAQRFDEPLDYQGDALFSAALVKASEQGSYLPVLMKNVWTHGAPAIATWDDFPIPEQFSFYVTGVIARTVGLFRAINLVFLGAAIGAGLALYLVMRLARVRWPIAAVLSGLYGISPYMFGRTVHHFNLIFYWYLPFVVLACIWLASRRGVEVGSRKFWLGAILCVVIGINSVYYLNFSLQLLVLAGLAGHLRRKTGTRAGLKTLLLWVAITVGSALLMNAHTLIFIARNGANTQVAARSATDLERFALKPLELVLPQQPATYAPLQKLAERYDQTQRILPSERTYLGMVGALGLLVTLAATLINFLRRRSSLVTDQGALVVWLMLYASPAGLNAVSGLVGFTLFRSVNRTSIVIMTISMLVFARLLSAATRRVRVWWLIPVAGAVALFALSEQLFPRRTEQQVNAMNALADSDRVLVEQLQTKIPKGSLVFQLPVVGFPEESFEPFRPFLYADGLRFSFAAMRGRPQAQWAVRTAGLPPDQMFAQLKQDGFSAIVTLGDSTSLFNAMKATHPEVDFLRSPNGALTAIVLAPTGSQLTP